MAIVESETGAKFSDVLKDAGVFKQTEEGNRAFHRFLADFGLKPA